MTKQEMVIFAAIISTLAETGGSPESFIWLGLQSQIGSLDAFYDITATLKASKLITISHNYVELTEKGKNLAQFIKDSQNGTSKTKLKALEE